MSQSFHWETEPEKTFTEGFARYGESVLAELRAIARYFEPQIEAWMKQNAKWVDRTGNARQGLYADVYNLVLGARLILDHSMEYGFFLELSRQGEYAIIKPALDYWSPIIWAEVKRRFS